MKLRKLLYLVPALLLASCDMVYFNEYDEITPGTVKVNVPTIESGKDGISQSVALTSEGSWTAEIIGGDAQWLSVSPSSGSGSSNLTVTVAPFRPGELKRSAIVKVTSADGSFAGITVTQAWAEPKTEFVFHKATGINSGRAYLIVANSSLAAKPLSGNYGYLYVDPVVDQDGTITLKNKDLAWVFTAVDGGYTIFGSDERYLYQTGSYNSFNVSATRRPGEDVFSVARNDDGTFTITNVGVNKYMQYSTGYGSYGSYPTAQEGGVLPVLYEEEYDPNAAILVAKEEDITVDAGATSAVFAISSGSDWIAETDAEWVSFNREGSGNQDLVVRFSENKSFDTDRTAAIVVRGSGLEIILSLTQTKAVAGLSVSSSEISVPAGGTIASFAIESNVDWTVSAPSGISVSPASGKGNSTVFLQFPSNREKVDLVDEITVATTSELVEEKEVIVRLVRKTSFAKALPYGESFAENIGDFSLNDVALPEGSTYVWKHSGNANYGMKASSYFSGTAHASESWLVSPNLDLSELATASISFDICAANGVAGQYDDACYGLVIDGGNTTRVDLGFGADYAGKYAWFNRIVDLTPYVGKTVRFAIVYKSTDSNCPTVEVKNVMADESATFAAVIAKGAGKYKSKNALVVAVGGTNTVLYDGTAYMFAYEKGKVSRVGDIVDIDGATTTYNGCPEWNNPAFTYVSHGNTVKHPAAQVLNSANYAAYAAAPEVKYVKVTGTKSGYYVNFPDGKRISVYSNDVIPDGELDVYGYTIGYHSKNDYILLVATSFSEAQGGGGAAGATLDNAAIAAAHTEQWAYASGAKKVVAADGSEWVLNNTYANAGQVTIQMNKGKGSYVQTPAAPAGKKITRLVATFNSKNDGSGDSNITRTLDITDASDNAVVSDVAGKDLTAGISIPGTVSQLRIKPNETNGGACYILNITVTFE